MYRAVFKCIVFIGVWSINYQNTHICYSVHSIDSGRSTDLCLNKPKLGSKIRLSACHGSSGKSALIRVPEKISHNYGKLQKILSHRSYNLSSYCFWYVTIHSFDKNKKNFRLRKDIRWCWLNMWWTVLHSCYYHQENNIIMCLLAISILMPITFHLRYSYINRNIFVLICVLFVDRGKYIQNDYNGIVKVSL